jgi:thymidylate synthase (FAD)
MKVKLVSISKPVVDGLEDAQDLIAYCARVSNKNNQLNTDTQDKLINYCGKRAKIKHWSVFEMANMCVEIQTTRAISAQIIRHRSFSFQELSQRYCTVDSKSESVELRRTGSTNRQSSLEVIDDKDLNTMVSTCTDLSYNVYSELINAGVARETARGVLPMSAPTTLYVNGNIRSWIHYIQVRTDEHTQKEHRDIAYAIKDLLLEAYPILKDGIDWNSQKQTQLMTRKPKKNSVANAISSSTLRPAPTPVKPKVNPVPALAESHWKYIRGLLASQGINNLEAFAYLYKTAFEHGAKHGAELADNSTWTWKDYNTQQTKVN